MIYPIPKAALKACASDRLKELAKPKKNFQVVFNRPIFVYSIGRPSVIWPVAEMALKAQISDRLRQLAKPKRSAEENADPKHYMRYNMGRPSVIWQVSDGAKHYVVSDKIAALAKPKGFHSTFQPDKEPTELGTVASDAIQHVATENTEVLSRPKEKVEGPFFEMGYPEELLWPISQGALAYEPTETIIKLAEPKFAHPEFLPDRELPWLISEAAKKVEPSPRDIELAKPQRRATMDHVQFNPDAFLVKPNALKAACSPRVDELSTLSLIHI